MKLLLVTDAWFPQINGVVRTLNEMREGLTRRGWEVVVLGPSGTTIPCPSYPEIRLTLQPLKSIRKVCENWAPDAVHIATEGPLGRAMLGYCARKGWRYTTSFHTRFPEYLKSRWYIPRRWTYIYLRLFHSSAERVLAPSRSIQKELLERGLRNVQVWGRGVDLETFHPSKRKRLPWQKPVQLYVGRLAVEKNIDAFLSLDTPGTKIVVGDGPERKRLQKKYPQAVFMGALKGERLAEIYASADVFVFPSKTDTFGLVVLEALASGTPVAAYPAPGPLDTLSGTRAGVVHEDLRTAIEQALTLSREECREFAENHSWDHSVDTFARALVDAQITQRLPEELDVGSILTLT